MSSVSLYSRASKYDGPSSCKNILFPLSYFERINSKNCKAKQTISTSGIFRKSKKRIDGRFIRDKF